MDAYFPVCQADALPAGTCKSFDVAGHLIIVAHLKDGFHAVGNRCTHLDSRLSTERIYHGGQIACPIHGARFDLRTGAAKSPPAFRPLALFPVRVREGQVEVMLRPVR